MKQELIMKIVVNEFDQMDLLPSNAFNFAPLVQSDKRGEKKKPGNHFVAWSFKHAATFLRVALAMRLWMPFNA